LWREPFEINPLSKLDTLWFVILLLRIIPPNKRITRDNNLTTIIEIIKLKILVYLEHWFAKSKEANLYIWKGIDLSSP
jgi:hypothetical protein